MIETQHLSYRDGDTLLKGLLVWDDAVVQTS